MISANLTLINLREKFKQAEYKHIEIADLKFFIEDKLEKLLNQNVTRLNFAEKLQRIINEYNSGSLSVENYFEDLIDFLETIARRRRTPYPGKPHYR